MHVFPKFIIEEDNLILSKCTYHKELATDIEKVKGGGWFTFDMDKKTFTFSGSSHDFGAANIENIKTAIESDKVFTNRRLTHSISKEYKFFYSKGSELIPLN